jgi:ribosome-associated heat shock protein Hsp15
VRIDKWLWAARFYKTRSLAQQAVAAGKVRCNSDRVKPARELHVDDRLAIAIGDAKWDITVRRLSDKRGAAPIARTLYEESADSVARREQQSALRKLTIDPAFERHGRPTKHERRQLERWRGE